jgi:hypothetical protein
MVESVQMAKISASSIVVYNRFLEPPKRSHKQVENEVNLRDVEYNGFMSPKTSQKVRKMLDSWLTAVELERKRLGQGAYYRNSKVTFVTLTLSSKQRHNDNEIKRKMLNRFIIELRREKGVYNYFWRAEPQKNGNIHFHVLIDKYIPWREIRDKWNAIQGDNGYLSDFYSKFMHLDPNSTDIHGLGKVKSLVAYVVKYCCKTKAGRKIDGRIWGCSDALRGITAFETDVSSDVHAYLEQVEKEPNVKVIVKDDFTLILCDNEKMLKKFAPALFKNFKGHYQKIFNSLYSSEGRRLHAEEMERIKLLQGSRPPIKIAPYIEQRRAVGSLQFGLFGQDVLVRHRKQ